MASASIASAKTLLRAEMRAVRRNARAACPDAAERAARLLPLDRLPPFRVVSGYAPQGAEIDPHPLMHRLEAAGARLALPVAVTIGAPLLFRAWRPRPGLVGDAAGILAPPPDAEALEPDLVIVPLLAFDRSGLRLGQGAGYFDRTLAALEARRPVFKLGLAYAAQEVARAPAEEHDRRLDAILTEIEYIAVRKDA
jgi:5-formyltetrahydrofolate cyclo-ligase